MTGETEKSGPSFLKMSAAVAVGQAAFEGIKKAGEMLVSGLKDVVRLAGESEAVMAQTNAVVASTKGVAGMSAQAIADLASSLSSVIPIDDEVIQSTENVMLTFTNIGKDIFPRATESILDMSIAMSMDTKSSAIMLGKALQDPISGMTALSKVGALNKDDFKRLSAEWKDGTVPLLKQQTQLLDALEVEFGKSGRIAGQTFPGQLKILGTHFDNIKESIGTTIITAITPFIKKLTDWAATDEAQSKIKEISTKVGEMTEKMVNWVTQVATPWIKEHWPAIKKVVAEVGEKIAEVSKFIWEHKAAFEAIITAIIAIKVFDTIMGIANAFKALGGFIGLLPATIVMGIAIDVDLILKAIEAVKGLKKEVGGMDSQTKQAWWDSLSFGQKAAAAITGGAEGLKFTQGQGFHFAEGTDFAPGGMALVGEKGPEIVNLPRGSQVVPNNKIGSSNITININGNADKSVVDYMVQKLSRMTELNRLGVPS